MPLVDRLIAHAAKTPYFNIPGYMDRDWLLPPRRVIKRTEYIHQPVQSAMSRSAVYRSVVRTDNTGPVDWRKRPISWALQWTQITARIHKILRSDKDDYGHNHPWGYLSIILRGSYVEHEFDASGNWLRARRYYPGDILIRRANHFHKLTVAEGPVITLFIAWRKTQSWGFMKPGGEFVPWREHVGNQ